MQFSVRISDYQKNIMVNMCDTELIGKDVIDGELKIHISDCLLYTSPSPRDQRGSRMPSSA